MLLSSSIILSFNIPIKGIIHVGSHLCEEYDYYNNELRCANIIWIDALKDKVDKSLMLGFKNVYCACLSNEDNNEVIFNRANNGYSSSFLDLKLHKVIYPHIHYIKSEKMNTITGKTFLHNNNIDASKFNFLNLDVQGCELYVLKGFDLKYFDFLYLEVSEIELYDGDCSITELDNYLFSKGFKREYTYIQAEKWGEALYVKINYGLSDSG